VEALFAQPGISLTNNKAFFRKPLRQTGVISSEYGQAVSRVREGKLHCRLECIDAFICINRNSTAPY